MSGLLIWRHSANISKLIAGTEGRIGQKSAPAAPADAAGHHGHGHGHHGGAPAGSHGKAHGGKH
jgi:glycerol-3-phosphate acyltransferase PlsY